VADQERRRDSGLDCLLVFAANDEPIDDRFHLGVDGRSVFGVRTARVVLARLGLDAIREIDSPAINEHPAAALLPHLGKQHVEVLAIDREDRRPELDFGAFRKRQDGFEDLTGRAAWRRLARARTVRLTDRSVEQIQVTCDVGHRADGRSRIVRQRLLLNRDHRRQAKHVIDIRLADLRDETFGKAGQRLQVSPLPFGVNRVECEAGLSRTRETGDDCQTIARDLDGNVLQVVNARALYGNRGARRARRLLRRGVSLPHR